MVGPSSADSANSHHGCFSRVQKAKGIAEAGREQTAVRTLHTAVDIQGPYTSGYSKFKTIQDFSRLLEKLIQDVLMTYVLLSVVK